MKKLNEDPDGPVTQKSEMEPCPTCEGSGYIREAVVNAKTHRTAVNRISERDSLMECLSAEQKWASGSTRARYSTPPPT